MQESASIKPTMIGTIQQKWSRFFSTFMPHNPAEILPLDGLRALAALMVIVVHVQAFGAAAGANTGTPFQQSLAMFGFAGVSLFFILTGFLLYMPYVRAMLDDRPLPAIGTFYLRRIVRILPLYYIASAILILFNKPALLLKPSILLLNALMLGDLSPSAFGAVSGQLWSLSIEFQFYMILPLLAYLLKKLAGKPRGFGFYCRLLLGLVMLIAIGLSIRYFAAHVYYTSGINPMALPGMKGIAYRLIYGVKGKSIELFALGMLGSVVYVKGIQRRGIPVMTQRFLGLISIVVAGAGLYGCLLWTIVDGRSIIWSAGEMWQVFGDWSLGVCFLLLLLGILLSPPVIGSLFSFAPLRYLGMISYSMYVWHYQIILSLAPVIVPFHKHGAYGLLFAATCVVTFVVATGSYYLIEKPFMQLRAKRNKTVPITIAPNISLLVQDNDRQEAVTLPRIGSVS